MRSFWNFKTLTFLEYLALVRSPRLCLLVILAFTREHPKTYIIKLKTRKLKAFTLKVNIEIKHSKDRLCGKGKSI